MICSNRAEQMMPTDRSTSRNHVGFVLLWFCVLLLGISCVYHPNLALAHREASSVLHFGGKGESPGRSGEITFWDFDSTGSMFISDADNLRVQKLSPRGQWLFTIDGSEKDAPYVFRNPSDIAVNGQGHIFVADWLLLPIEGYDAPPLYTYAPGIHQFASDGSWVSTFPLEPPTQNAQFMDLAAPGLDADGQQILIIPQGDTERGFRLSATTAGDVFALDEGTLYHFDSSGQAVGAFQGTQQYPGWFADVADIVAMNALSIYLVDTLRHRIVEVDASGRIVRTIGRYGDQDGQLESPQHLTILADGDLLVTDQAHYDRSVDSLMARRRDDPSARSLYESLGRRRLQTRLLRAQRFSPEGKFVDKILLRLDRESAYERALHWLALSPTGQLYLQHPDTLVVEQYVPTGGLKLDALRTELSVHYEQDEMTVEIDNPEDLDVRRDFDETWQLKLVTADLQFRYDYNERMQISWEHTGLYLHSKQEDFYAQDAEDISRGAFNQSDKTLEDYLAGLTQIGFDWILADEPYDYRTAGISIYMGGGRYGVINDAIDTANQRYLDWNLWFAEWGGGFHYDIAQRWQIRMDVSHGPAYGYFNYEFDYIDEVGVLFATGFREGTQTQVFFAVNGVF